ncbi:MAG: DUF1553 domain-containing protein [Planctomycetota bacterium]
MRNLSRVTEELADSDRKRISEFLELPWKDGQDTKGFWAQLESALSDYRIQVNRFDTSDSAVDWRLGEIKDYQQWYRHGSGLTPSPSQAGDFALANEGDQVLKQIFPSGAFSHLLSDKHSARFESADVMLDGPYKLWLQVVGSGKSMSRYVVQDYPRNGTVFPVTEYNGRDWRWQSYDLKYWEGDEIHVELTTANDAPLLVKNQSRSWFGLRRAVLAPADQAGPPGKDRSWLQPILDSAKNKKPQSRDELVQILTQTIASAVEAWSADEATDEQALLLDRCAVAGILPNRQQELPGASELLSEYRKLEADVPVLRRVPTLGEWKGQDSPLFARGNHKQPEDLVPRRFLEAIDETPYASELSGRLQLAQDMLREDNPFTSRVIVNRIWHHLFGAGIVATTDNFGRLGTQPTHPELLDYLADDFRKSWSLKGLIRQIVLSETWQQASDSSSLAEEKDPNNQLLSHASVRRLDAEAIRDSLLVAAGSLDATQFGGPVAGGSNRRSVYVNVIRNRLDPFLTTFDAPVPFSTKGRRDVTNVPAQSLLMMNNPRVRQLASSMAERSSSIADSAERVRSLWAHAFGRQATQAETQAMLDFVDGLESGYEQLQTDLAARRQRIELLGNEVSSILEPVRRELELKRAAGDIEAVDLRPVGVWDFEQTDSASEFPLTLKGSAKFDGGALVLDGKGWAESKLPVSLNEKSLEALVSLDKLKQKGGGVMTIQGSDGVLFDSLVYAERNQREWMAGSDNFKRTEDFRGPREEEAKTEVHLVVVYAKDGTIACYRNGELYGKPYKTAVQGFKKPESMVLFGMRHGRSMGGGRMLTGSIFEAKLYDRALSAEEVASAAAGSNKSISRKQVLAELQPDQLKTVEELESQLRSLQAELDAMQVPDAGNRDAWTDLAHSLFNMKEFLYVR